MLLAPTLSAQLTDRYEKLLALGELLSPDQIEACYARFRQKFGPERLSNLDGEELLETMHNTSTRDSLVYWLEFKNDDEFPARFGSIAGGSSLKFGLFRRRETGQWVTGSPQKQQVLSIPEAIALARRHRDQLLAGVELLEALPANASDADYARLQTDLDRLAPNVSDTAWGHKYFSLLFPTQLDDYHNPYFQRFYLIRLLQTPVAAEGRYSCARQYVSIAHELGIWINHLTSVLNRVFGKPYRYWRVGTRDDGNHKDWWPEMRHGGQIAIGWAKAGDLSWVEYNQESKSRLRQRMSETYYPDSPAAAGRNGNKLFNFAVAVSPEDVILAADGQKILGIGKVRGAYSFDAASEWPHHRPVEWLSDETWQLPENEGLLSALSELTKTPNQIEIERRLLFAPPLNGITSPKPAQTRLTGLPARIQDVLERKRQVILYGPPGTGKTYWAMQTARQILAAEFGTTFENLTPAQQAEISGSAEKPGRVRTCTFHPSYGYEDFIEGYRPLIVKEQPAFRLVDGVFKRLCQDAAAQPDRKFFLVVDEINRGDIPRIFGELLTLLEKDKRGQAALLPVSGQPFQVPYNIYVIGTMNTADRSIALLDTALRRRFGFIELMPDPALLNVTLANTLPLGAWLAALNQRIVASIGRDARNLQIGHAYFLENGRPVSDFGRFARILQEDILPLLEEYCYEDYDALEKILGSSLVDRANQCLRIELLDPAKQDDLLAALLNPDPSIAMADSSAILPEPTDENDDEAP